MARYFFDFRDDGDLTHDQEGLDLPDAETAKEEAMRALTEIAKVTLPQEGSGRELGFIIRGEQQPVAEAVIRVELRTLH
jgi:hypothetical protein